jgi:hypothetical protein
MNIRNILFLFLTFLLSLSFVYASSEPVDCTVTPGYNVGDRGPSNGWIVYKKPVANGKSKDTCWQYLEVASSDLHGYQVWSNVSDKLSGKSSTVLGDGKKNTKEIMAQSGHEESAAKSCHDFIVDFKGNTFEDWFLPSKTELRLTYLRLHRLQILKKIKKLGGGWHWSSSEYDKNDAWAQDFGSDNEHELTKSYSYSVRCVRTF